ncbi:MAG: hypothetical protein ACXVDN_03755 [Ktedonobacteraceae bacterium]
MTIITRLRQRTTWLLLLGALVLSLSLMACGKQANASNSNIPNNNTVSQQQQYQPNSPVHTSNANTNANTNTNLQSTDQQVQSILGQLDGARNDVNSSNASSSQDNGQQP